ncbi:MAG: hypothetical protein JO278_00230 [Dyella sp.]|nr:hypothetical protein [Dyella sp.]
MTQLATANAASAMTEQMLRTALDGFGANEINHHGRPLTEHLVGTWRLLMQWQNPPIIALAGAFHSVYGTEEFKARALPLSKRPTLVALIGEEAEALVHLFGAADRKSLYNVPDAGPFSIALPATGESVLIDGRTYSSLIEIEAANIVEQAMHQRGVPAHVVGFWIDAFESKRHCLSAGAMNAVEAVLAGYRAQAGSAPGPCS